MLFLNASLTFVESVCTPDFKISDPSKKGYLQKDTTSNNMIHSSFGVTFLKLEQKFPPTAMCSNKFILKKEQKYPPKGRYISVCTSEFIANLINKQKYLNCK